MGLVHQTLQYCVEFPSEDAHMIAKASAPNHTRYSSVLVGTIRQLIPRAGVIYVKLWGLILSCAFGLDCCQQVRSGLGVCVMAQKVVVES